MPDHRTPGGLIIPGHTPRDLALQSLARQHSQAVATMTKTQLDAMNRVVLATMMVQATLNNLNAEPETLRDMAQASLLEVIRREARGAKYHAPMWTPASFANATQGLSGDHLRDIAERPVGDGVSEG